MGKLNKKGLDALLTKPPNRHPDGGGLFFKVAGRGKAYWTFRYSLGPKESETKLGVIAQTSLYVPRIRHLELRAIVAKKIDPVGKRNGAGLRSKPPPGRPSVQRPRIIPNARSDGVSTPGVDLVGVEARVEADGVEKSTVSGF